MAFQSGTVIKTRGDGSYLVKPVNERKIVQVKWCPTSICTDDEIDFALTVMRPKKTTDLGIFVNEETSGGTGIKDGMLINYFMQNAYPIPVIPETMAVNYASMPDLLEQFKGQGEIPFLFYGPGATYFTLYKVKTPFEETDENHEIYHKKSHARIGKVREFKGIELIAELAHDEYAKIHPPHKEREGLIYYQEIDTGSPLVILPVDENYYYVLHLIAGDMCRKQLQQWNFTDPKLKEFF